MQSCTRLYLLLSQTPNHNFSQNCVGENPAIPYSSTSTSSGFQVGKITPAFIPAPHSSRLGKGQEQAGHSSWRIYHANQGEILGFELLHLLAARGSENIP